MKAALLVMRTGSAGSHRHRAFTRTCNGCGKEDAASMLAPGTNRPN